jgi:hypothetical protein
LVRSSLSRIAAGAISVVGLSIFAVLRSSSSLACSASWRSWSSICGRAASSVGGWV